MTSHACCLKYITREGKTGWHLFEANAITPILDPSADGKCKCDRLTELLDFAYEVNWFEPYVASLAECTASEVEIRLDPVSENADVGAIIVRGSSPGQVTYKGYEADKQAGLFAASQAGTLAAQEYLQ